MISVIQDIDDKVIGYVEWRQVGQSGFDKVGGEYVWLQNLWIHHEFRGRSILQQLIADVLAKSPEAKYGYFTREKYDNRMSRLFNRASVERIASVLV